MLDCSQYLLEEAAAGPAGWWAPWSVMKDKPEWGATPPPHSPQDE